MDIKEMVAIWAAIGGIGAILYIIAECRDFVHKRRLFPNTRHELVFDEILTGCLVWILMGPIGFIVTIIIFAYVAIDEKWWRR